nr:uncharacterized protein LOC117273216 [Nicotiana tomentosiformis]
MSYNDLCMFPDIHLPAGFKMPKFNLYDGRGNPVAHLRGYCSEMRSVGGKDELLMAYFSESLSGAALEWYTYQDYNIDIIPNRSSLSKMEKMPSENFREYGLRWREQAARVSPPVDEEDTTKDIQNISVSLGGRKRNRKDVIEPRQ